LKGTWNNSFSLVELVCGIEKRIAVVNIAFCSGGMNILGGCVEHIRCGC
jgi:hypothetical protein